MTAVDFIIYTKEGAVTSLPAGKSVVALGTFDGVHSAHKMLLRRTAELKTAKSADLAGAWCFSEAPASVLTGKRIPLLCTLEKKIETMLSLGLDFVAVGDFRRFCNVSPEDFIEKVLKKELNCIGTVCGFNHHFGHKGAGDPSLLAALFGEEYAVVVPEVRLFSETVSSSSIRMHISEGNVGHAALMLGRPFALNTQVVAGKALGRDLGFPTANQYFPHETVIPAHGIYATRCITEDGKRYIGVSNIGIRPTITDGSDDHRANCETYIHGFEGDLYGKHLTVEFHEFLRAERRFESVEALKEQIGKDLRAAIEFFERASVCDIAY